MQTMVKDVIFVANMNIVLPILAIIALLVLLFLWISRPQLTKKTALPLPISYRAILLEHVPFYRALDPGNRTAFEERMMDFLQTTRITGVNTAVEEKDKVYIAASAIIPIFGFPDWRYINLHEVLLYPDSFNHDFEQTGAERNVLGMVGNGPLNDVMILSRHDLHDAFENRTGTSNTAIHEFVHLLDKTDGSIDGVPAFFADQQYIIPWLQRMRKEISQIRSNHSDINPYGATNEAEFFAVVAEYFFERPELLARKHPELYELLTKLFQQEPSTN